MEKNQSNSNAVDTNVGNKIVRENKTCAFQDLKSQARNHRRKTYIEFIRWKFLCNEITCTLPAHGSALHISISEDSPSQNFPPYFGSVQLRDFSRVPPPHVLLHVLHSLQSNHSPST